MVEHEQHKIQLIKNATPKMTWIKFFSVWSWLGRTISLRITIASEKRNFCYYTLEITITLCSTQELGGLSKSYYMFSYVVNTEVKRKNRDRNICCSWAEPLHFFVYFFGKKVGQQYKIQHTQLHMIDLSLTVSNSILASTAAADMKRSWCRSQNKLDHD